MSAQSDQDRRKIREIRHQPLVRVVRWVVRPGFLLFMMVRHLERVNTPLVRLSATTTAIRAMLILPAFRLSFQVGLTNHLEFFFTTEAYRAIKVNSPRNLSAFYFPNSQFTIAGFGLTRAPAIVLSPQGPGTSSFPDQAIYRPTGAPYVAFPYTAGNAGTFGLTPPFYSGPIFGFGAGKMHSLDRRVSAGMEPTSFRALVRFMAASFRVSCFESVSLIGPTGAPLGEGPAVFTLAPSYLPDAPFINHVYGESSFNDANVGIKWRFTSLSNPIGAGSFSYRSR